jgi:hypothetical protein
MILDEVRVVLLLMAHSFIFIPEPHNTVVDLLNPQTELYFYLESSFLFFLFFNFLFFQCSPSIFHEVEFVCTELREAVAIILRRLRAGADESVGEILSPYSILLGGGGGSGIKACSKPLSYRPPTPPTFIQR